MLLLYFISCVQTPLYLTSYFMFSGSVKEAQVQKSIYSTLLNRVHWSNNFWIALSWCLPRCGTELNRFSLRHSNSNTCKVDLSLECSIIRSITEIESNNKTAFFYYPVLIKFYYFITIILTIILLFYYKTGSFLHLIALKIFIE